MEIVRNDPVELTYQAPRFSDATFLAGLPSARDRLHNLAPKDYYVDREQESWRGQFAP